MPEVKCKKCGRLVDSGWFGTHWIDKCESCRTEEISAEKEKQEKEQSHDKTKFDAEMKEKVKSRQETLSLEEKKFKEERQYKEWETKYNNDAAKEKTKLDHENELKRLEFLSEKEEKAIHINIEASKDIAELRCDKLLQAIQIKEETRHKIESERLRAIEVAEKRRYDLVVQISQNDRTDEDKLVAAAKSLMLDSSVYKFPAVENSIDGLKELFSGDLSLTPHSEARKDTQVSDDDLSYSKDNQNLEDPGP